MRFSRSIIAPVLLVAAGVVDAASWGFDEAIISVSGKGAGVGGGFKDKYVNYTASQAMLIPIGADSPTMFLLRKPYP